MEFLFIDLGIFEFSNKTEVSEWIKIINCLRFKTHTLELEAVCSVKLAAVDCCFLPLYVMYFGTHLPFFTALRP
jgi:hypothetical protein